MFYQHKKFIINYILVLSFIFLSCFVILFVSINVKAFAASDTSFTITKSDGNTAIKGTDYTFDETRDAITVLTDNLKISGDGTPTYEFIYVNSYSTGVKNLTLNNVYLKQDSSPASILYIAVDDTTLGSDSEFILNIEGTCNIDKNTDLEAGFYIFGDEGKKITITGDSGSSLNLISSTTNCMQINGSGINGPDLEISGNLAFQSINSSSAAICTFKKCNIIFSTTENILLKSTGSSAIYCNEDCHINLLNSTLEMRGAFPGRDWGAFRSSNEDLFTIPSNYHMIGSTDIDSPLSSLVDSVSIKLESTYSCYSSFIGDSVAKTVYICESSEPITYQIIDGAGAVIDLANLKDASFTSNAEYSKFSNVVIDGEEIVQEEDFDVTEGSTVVTLHKGFLKNLDIGQHDIFINSTDGYATATFEVVDSSAKSVGASTDTSDNFFEFIMFVFMMNIFAILLFFVAYKKLLKL